MEKFTTERAPFLHTDESPQISRAEFERIANERGLTIPDGDNRRGPNPFTGTGHDGFCWRWPELNGHDRSGDFKKSRREMLEFFGVSSPPQNRDFTVSISRNGTKQSAAISSAQSGAKSPESRGISAETLKFFGVNRVKTAKFDGWKYPTHHADGTEARTRFKNAQRKPKYQWWSGGDGRNPDAYNIQNVPDNANEVWVVGGEPDVWAMHQNGFLAVAPFGETQGEKTLVRALIEKRVGRLQIALDNDNAGRQGAANIARECATLGIAFSIRTFSGLDGHDVCDEFARAGYNSEQFRAAMDALPTCDEPLPNAFNEEIEWPEPRSLKCGLIPVEPLSPCLLPENLQAWVLDCARRLNVPLEYVAVPAIIGAASLIGNTISIRPKQRDDWRVVPNLWGAIVGCPSAKKTPSINEALKPISRLKSFAIEKHRAEMRKWEADALIDSAGADALKSEIKRLQKSGATREKLQELVARSQQTEEAKPSLKTYSIQDATIEALANVLKNNPRGVLIERDELTGWIRGFDKQNHQTDRSFFLEAFNGTGRNIQIERVTRGQTIIPHNTISILGTIQPQPFAQIIRSAISGGENADGFVARFQMMVYPDPLPFEYVDDSPDEYAQNLAFSVFESLDNIAPEMAGASIDSADNAYLRFAPDAQSVFREWLTDLENRLDNDSPLVAQHLAKYRSLMPSLALIFDLIERAPNFEYRGGVRAHNAKRAVEWCEFLEHHARRIYGMALGEQKTGVHLILSRMESLPNPFTVRDVHQKNWAGLSSRDDVENAVVELEKSGWIRRNDSSASVGGRPTHRFFKHPKLP